MGYKPIVLLQEKVPEMNHKTSDIIVEIDAIQLGGILTLPQDSRGLVLFAHGSGSSRFSPRNQEVAANLNEAGLGTLLFDLLTEEEDAQDMYTREFRFDIPMLSERLVGASQWVLKNPDTKDLNIAYFGSSTGAAAALIAAARVPEVKAVVSRGGRVDLAKESLAEVTAPTLMIVGGLDDVVIELNRASKEMMTAHCELEIIPEASHLFEEGGTLDQVVNLAINWFKAYL